MLNKIDMTLVPVENFHSELLLLSLKHTQKLWLEISKATFGASQWQQLWYFHQNSYMTHSLKCNSWINKNLH